MQKKIIVLFIFSGLLCLAGCQNNNASFTPDQIRKEDKEIKQTYRDCGLEEKLRFDIFRRALLGALKIEPQKPHVITIIDFTKPSSEKRCLVVDLQEHEVLFHTYVAHGSGSGENYAKIFSNKGGSHCSSLGFYKTAETYQGKHGYSLRLDGLEQGINHNARNRAIVIHGAKYVNPDFIKKQGRLGRSWGCPAFAPDVAPKIIDAIRNGSCLYIHADDEAYLSQSLYGK